MIDQKDQDYGYLALEKFGYKCSIIRNDRNRKLLMETFVPILVEKGNEKISKINNKINNNQSGGPIDKTITFQDDLVNDALSPQMSNVKKSKH